MKRQTLSRFMELGKNLMSNVLGSLEQMTSLTPERSTDSIFLRFEECPRCHIPGREKVLSVWSDGHKYCFWCELVVPVSTLAKIKDSIPDFKEKEGTKLPNNLAPIPSTATNVIGVQALEWLKKYGITDQEVKQNNLLWEDQLQWLIFPYYRQGQMDKQLMGWQARRFVVPANPVNWNKWLTYGPKSDWSYYIGLANLERSPVIIMVEDIISAIKVGRNFCAMPLFGSHVSLRQLVSLAEKGKVVGSWLDRDKASESYKAAARTSQYVPRAISIVSERDPKEFTDVEIHTKVTNAFPALDIAPF